VSSSKLLPLISFEFEVEFWCDVEDDDDGNDGTFGVASDSPVEPSNSSNFAIS
jgi:hypothetical protein